MPNKMWMPKFLWQVPLGKFYKKQDGTGPEADPV